MLTLKLDMRAKRKLRVLVLAHEELIPPDSIDQLSKEEQAKCRTERDVIETLKSLGHKVYPVGVHGELDILKSAINQIEPHVVFNLLEEFNGNALYDQNIVSLLELLGQPYTGSNPRGLMVSHDKALSKKILAYHNIPVPRFVLFGVGKEILPPKDLAYPLLVKSQTEEGSLGVSQASLVYDRSSLIDRVKFIHRRLRTNAIAEQFIEGRELYVSILGNRSLKVFPIWELSAENLPPGAELIATDKLKWDEAYQRKVQAKTARAKGLSAKLESRIIEISRMIYGVLGLSGYARLDFRLGLDGMPYFLEANPNPNIAADEDFARSAEAGGFPYSELLQKIVTLGMSYFSLEEQQPLALAL